MNKYNMTPEQQILFDSIKKFDFDESQVALPFVKRLACENGWSIVYSNRVIDEYRKFAFLAVSSGHAVTPSDQVDQAWHLHLQYTEYYWKQFCHNTLKMPLHHQPTKGGSLDKDKFENWYEKTLDSYSEFFGINPPDDIWPVAAIRFGEDLHYQRVNKRRVWIVPKNRVYQFCFSLVVVIGIVEFL
jgi:hypothetical protein